MTPPHFARAIPGPAVAPQVGGQIPLPAERLTPPPARPSRPRLLRSRISAVLGPGGQRDLPTYLAEPRARRPHAAFTLVELLIGMSLSMVVMAAVLSSYVFVARSYTRTLGITSANQPNIEAQGRRTLELFAQDVRMASGFTGTPTAATVTLSLPTATGSTTIAWTYLDPDADPATADGTLTRAPAVGDAQVLHMNLLACVFTYHDAGGHPYTSLASYLIGVKQLSLSLTAQAGNATNQTLGPVYVVESPRLLFRNKGLLP